MYEPRDDRFYAHLKERWRCFIDTGIIPDDVRPYIADSWRRCARKGINAFQPAKPSTLSDESFRKKMENNQDLVEIARPIIDKINHLVGDTQNLISLHDKDCYMLAYACDEYYNTVRGKTSFMLGARWDEAVMGTNGVALSIILDQPVQIYGAEHFCENQHDGTCSAAPIHNGAGEIIGCLNITGTRFGNLHTLGLAACGAYAIENQLALYQSYQVLDNTFSTINEGIMVVDEELRIIRTSYRVARILHTGEASLQNVPLTDIFPSEDFRQKLFQGKKPFSYIEQDFCINGKIISCNVSVTPTIIKNKVMGAILLLRESAAINEIANKVSGNKSRYTFDSIVTQDEGIRRIVQTMKDISSTDCTVLIEGESGTGKELFAHSTHSYSARRSGPFIAVNCGSLPHSLVESELFGYEKGAFTGASGQGNPGKFELANGGTIFLDEVGELPLEIQVKLLRVLDTHRISRIGSRTEKELDVRVIAATNRNLRDEVANFTFREDLYYRLNVLMFTIPPLRKRKGDIPLLVRTFLEEVNLKQDAGHVRKEVSDECMECLCQYKWPGNVRELHHSVLRAYYCSGEAACITPEHLLETIRQPDQDQPVRHDQAAESTGNGKPGEPAERERLLALIQRFGKDYTHIAESLDISVATLYRKLKKHGLKLYGKK